MKLITRNTDYAVRALCYIARQNKKEIVSAAHLNQTLKIPRPFLRKILQILNKRGLIKSYKGQGGGFSLAVSPQKISLVDVINIFQGPLQLKDCVLRKSICPDLKVCLLKKKLDAIEKFMVSELKVITIASLLKEIR